VSPEVRDAIARVLEGRVLDVPSMESAMDAILEGRATDAQIAALAVGLRMRGETASEVSAAARSMRRKMTTIGPFAGEILIDTCGTGGDGASTFNVSTTCALVVAACGVKVAKHGNRAVSSRAGSADVIEALGITLEPSIDVVAQQIRGIGIGFLFAPAFHAALRHAARARRELGSRTFFNLLGPLANPANATHQLVGVYDPARVGMMAEVLGLLGLRGAWVVHGHGGLDEISPSGPTRVARLENGKIDEFEVAPSDFGLESVAMDGMMGGDAIENARLLRAVLDGEPGVRRMATVLNAAAALALTGVESDLRAARDRAEEAIDSGAARRLLATWASWGQ
jgi:anthranilate phosphoribosyltransferase